MDLPAVYQEVIKNLGKKYYQTPRLCQYPNLKIQKVHKYKPTWSLELGFGKRSKNIFNTK